MNVVILSIGDELVLGQTVDTNSAWISDQLVRRGIIPALHLTVADDRSAIARALRLAVDQADLVIATGGLGPTEDDLTRFALADVMDVELMLDDTALQQIEAFFSFRKRAMSKLNRVQAMCPAGATMLSNSVGTAPGIRAVIGRTIIYALPGVPVEMQTIWNQHVAPTLPTAGNVILTATLHTFGKGESDVAALLGKLMARDRNPTVGTTVSTGIVSIRIRSSAADHDAAQQALDDTIAQVQHKLGDIVFGRDEQTLPGVVGEMLRQRKQTLAVAESCTGGLLSKLLTDLPGASDYFLGGFVTYTDDFKLNFLGVDQTTLAQHGAVSEPVAIQMADGALQRTNADYALSVTGIAGPDGGSPDKPVGTVCFGLAQRNQPTVSQRLIFPGDRAIIRLRSAHHALNMLRLRMMNGE